jgi:PAS domain S-box-containing protein
MPEPEALRILVEVVLVAIAGFSIFALWRQRRRAAAPGETGPRDLRAPAGTSAPEPEGDQDRFRTFAELSSDWLYETDADLRLTWLSDSFSKLSAVPASELIGTRMWDDNVGSLDDWESLKVQRDLMERREPFRDFVYSLTTRDGETYWRRSSAVPRYDTAGRFLGYRGATSDITGQIATDRNFRRLMEDLPDGIFVQQNGIVEYVNARLVDMMGGESDADFVGRDSLILFHPNDHDDVRARRARLRDSDVADHAVRQHLVRCDGTSFFAEGTGTRIDWQGGPAILVVLRDISDRIAAEEERREAEERFRSFASSTSDWFWETGPDLRISWISDTFTKLTGLSGENVLGKLLWETAGNDHEELDSIAQCLPMMEAHRPFRGLRYSVRPPGDTVHWRVTSGQPHFDAAGTFLGYRGATTDITHEVEAERRFQYLIEETPDLILVHRDDKILYGNPALVRAFRVTRPEDIIGSSTLELYHPEDWDQIRRRRKNLNEGAPFEGMHRQRLVRKDGTEFVGEVSAAPIHWEGERAIMVTLRDISKQVAAEEARSAGEERYRLLAELMPEAFLIQSDGKGLCERGGPRHLRQSAGNRDHGHARDRPRRRRQSRHDPPTPQPRPRDGSGGGTRPRPSRARRRRSVRDRKHRRPDGMGRTPRDHQYCFRRQRSHRGGTRPRGKRSPISRFRAIDFRLVLGDRTGRRFTWFSFERHPVVGIPAEDVIGKRSWEFAITDPDAKATWAAMPESLAMNNKPFRDVVVSGHRADGTAYFISVSGTPRFGPDGEFLGHRGSGTDITAQHNLENQLQQALKMEAIGQLTGGIAHDFNNLLAIISGNLELMLENADDGRSETQFIRPALNAAARGADLTRYLLAFARQQPLSPRSVDVNRLVMGMTDPLRRALGAQIELETVVTAGSWQAYVDPAQTETAILNLALNARDAMPNGGKLTIETANAVLDDE